MIFQSRKVIDAIDLGEKVCAGAFDGIVCPEKGIPDCINFVVNFAFAGPSGA